MLKSIIRPLTLATTAMLGLMAAPAFAESSAGACTPCCTSNCVRQRPCQYNFREVSSVSAPALPVPQGDAPVQMVDPPAVETPMLPTEPTPLPRPRRGRGTIRGRG
jgi:hypothetical protein